MDFTENCLKMNRHSPLDVRQDSGAFVFEFGNEFGFQVHRVPVLVPIYELGQAHRIMHESADTLAVGDAVRPLEVSECCEKTTCSL